MSVALRKIIGAVLLWPAAPWSGPGSLPSRPLDKPPGPCLRHDAGHVTAGRHDLRLAEHLPCAGQEPRLRPAAATVITTVTRTSPGRAC